MEDYMNLANEWIARLEGGAGTWMNDQTADRLAAGLNDPRGRDRMALALLDPTCDARTLAARAADHPRLPAGMGEAMDVLRRRPIPVTPRPGRLTAARDTLSTLAGTRPGCAAGAMDLALLVFWLAGDKKGLDAMLARPMPGTVVNVTVRFARDHDMWPAGAAVPRTYRVPELA